MRRRDFLRASGQAGLSLALAQWSGCSQPQEVSSPSPVADGYHYQVGPWTGDSFPAMHKIRDGFHAPLPKPERKVKLLIIGAGLSGMGLGYLCRDMDLLILERESTAGGNAKSANYKGIEYALGSAYLVDVDKPFGELYRELGLDLTPISQPGESVWTPGGFVPLEKGPLAKTIERIQKEMRVLLTGDGYPTIPIQKAGAKALALDDISYYDWLQKDYPDYVPQADEYCWTALGGDSRKISAYIGVSGLSELVMDIYAFPGGNAAVAKRLEAGIEKAGSGRIMNGQSVYRVDPAGAKVRVGFFDTHAENPELRCIEADQVVLACPYYFAARLIPWAQQQALTTMRSLEYGSYLVANLCFEGQVFHQGYDHWAPGNNQWADFVDADYPTGNQIKDASVITVYAPFREAMVGRALLLQGDGRALCSKIVEDVQLRTGFPKDKLREVNLTRYGHQIFCSRRGVVRQMLALPRHHGNVHLCHSDGQACASIESALSEAFALAPVLHKKIRA
ncbi:MAG: FAD-dependent oxidoreductase [Candidatus Eremiobacteraeota bacterium]|nr:FAD-dependent oxidoreductase [Candidatus Eremiobacteraeota bacterium]MCW5869592.1 FAD-dependent oxidoreductase [Candidatus Eremiobacteraeota bacterium]